MEFLIYLILYLLEMCYLKIVFIQYIEYYILNETMAILNQDAQAMFCFQLLATACIVSSVLNHSRAESL